MTTRKSKRGQKPRPKPQPRPAATKAGDQTQASRTNQEQSPPETAVVQSLDHVKLSTQNPNLPPSLFDGPHEPIRATRHIETMLPNGQIMTGSVPTELEAWDEDPQMQRKLDILQRIDVLDGLLSGYDQMQKLIDLLEEAGRGLDSSFFLGLLAKDRVAIKQTRAYLERLQDRLFMQLQEQDHERSDQQASDGERVRDTNQGDHQ